MTRAALTRTSEAQDQREDLLRTFFNRFLVAAAETGTSPRIKDLIVDLKLMGIPVSEFQIKSWSSSPWGQAILDECFGDSRATAHTMLSMNLPNMLQKMIDVVLEGGPSGVSAFRALTPWFEHGDLLPRSLEAGEASAAGLLLQRYKIEVRLEPPGEIVDVTPRLLES